MNALHRWAIVALTTALAIGTPLALRSLPVSTEGTSVVDQLTLMQSSQNTSYSGYVESLGTLQLPVSDELDQLGPLFGERTRLRVWWDSPEIWRVDQVSATGEVDLVRQGKRLTSWEYEGTNVTTAPESSVRLPRVTDLLPPELARFLLNEADVADTAAIPGARIAGRAAFGLRVRAPDDRSRIDHVDVWGDVETGVPLRIAIYGVGADNADLSSTFLDFVPGKSQARVFAFQAPRGAIMRQQQALDIADAANRFAPVIPPNSVADLERVRNDQLRSVGNYGQGMTRVVVIPLWGDIASPLRKQLSSTPTAEQLTEGPSLAAGPLNLLLTRFPNSDAGWLIVGTVTTETLQTVAVDLQGARSRPRTITN
ncbi:MAG: hypothetical protein ABI720_02750 [Actinomycetes bacterium]